MPRKGEYKDLKGQKFGRLTVLEFSHKQKKQTMWKCKCECGKELVVSSSHLRSGHTKSCGCLSRERIARQNYKTGMTKSSLYYVYRNMLNRCYWKSSKMYQYYGGRGILVCDEWADKEHGFEKFMEWAHSAGYSESLTLDRIDCNKGYSPDNCRWVDVFVQANNKRTTRYIKVNGEIDTVANMARKHDIDYWSLIRYANGGRNMKYPHLEIEVADGR